MDCILWDPVTEATMKRMLDGRPVGYYTSLLRPASEALAGGYGWNWEEDDDHSGTTYMYPLEYLR